MPFTAYKLDISKLSKEIRVIWNNHTSEWHKTKQKQKQKERN